MAKRNEQIDDVNNGFLISKDRNIKFLNDEHEFQDALNLIQELLKTADLIHIKEIEPQVNDGKKASW